jgi:hypothetical protein
MMTRGTPEEIGAYRLSVCHARSNGGVTSTGYGKRRVNILVVDLNHYLNFEMSWQINMVNCFS